jgi:hypothetical protein
MATVLMLHWTLGAGWHIPWLVAAIVALVFLLVIAPGVALSVRAGTLQSEWLLESQTAPRTSSPAMSQPFTTALLLLLLAPLVAFGWFVAHTIFGADAADTAFTITRMMGGGIVSPGPSALCLFAAIYAGIFSGLRRLSLMGNGFTALADGSPTFRLLVGAAQERPGSALRTGSRSTDEQSRDLHHFVSMLDMPVQHFPKALMAAIVIAVAAAAWSVGQITTVDGRAFSWFVTLGSLSVLATALVSLAQAAEIWNALRSKLVRLSRTRLEPVFESIGRVVSWNLSMVPPHLTDLMPLAQGVDRMRTELIAMTNVRLPRDPVPTLGNRRAPMELGVYADRCASAMGLRVQDISALSTVLDGQSQMDRLREEIVLQRHAPLLQSRAWWSLWRVSDKLVTLLEEVPWQRSPVSLNLPETVSPSSTHSTAVLAAMPGVAERHASRERHDLIDVDSQVADSGFDAAAITAWFIQCERVVALQCAFLLREVLARIMSSLFTAMLCLAFLTAAHLFYLFQGRSSLLTVDMLTIAGAALLSLWIVIGMERDTVLSRLRVTTPGQVDFNWDFVKRVAIYGVLPLIAVIGSLFPEVGESLFGWMEPLRKLTAF